MWDTVRRVTGKDTPREYRGPTAEKLNQYFADISRDPAYETPLFKATANQSLNEFTEYFIFHRLERLKPTATGLDGLPVWFLRLSAPWIASVISHIFNMSYVQSCVVPEQWKLSCITPVPKTNQPVDCVDFKPISVTLTPVLSRVLERLIVRRDLYPVLVNPDVSHLFHDQFAFRPTGSATAALIYLFHHLTHSLKNHNSVHLVALDFSKAFDTVRHSTLAANRAFTHDDRYDDRYAYRSSYQASKHCLRIWPRPLACLRRRICSLQMEEVNTF